MTWLLAVLAVGAVLRFTVLINRDAITEPARSWIMVRAVRAEDRADEWRLANGWQRIVGSLYWRGAGLEPSLPYAYRAKWRGGFWPWLDNLIGCPWCVSVYVAVPVAFVVVWFPTNRSVLAGLLACTASWVAGLSTEAIKHRSDQDGD